MSTANPPTGLQAVAAAMKRTAQRTPNKHAYRRLSHGLNVVYGLKDGHWRIAIGRQAPSSPSHQELQIIATAFGAPCDFEPVHRQAQWWDPLEERSRTYNVLELTWREVFQTSDEDLAVA